jgi:hypothetical protein
VLKAQPHQRLRWHYFLLWQMIGVETWLATFTQGGAAPLGAARPVVREGA